MMFRLVHQAARENAIQAIRQAPDGWVVKVTEPTRSLEQNALLHAELRELVGRKWCGMTLDVRQWKRLMTLAWMRATQQGGVLYVQSVDGQGMDVIYQRTSTMSKAEMSELIEYIKAWKAENVPQQEIT
jgi:hypothetical protein